MKLLFFGILLVFMTIGINQADAIKTVSNDGGDCTSFGKWDSASKTCTLTGNLNEEIDVGSNGVTIDGKGFTITGTGIHRGDSAMNPCILLDARTGVTIKDIKFQGCAHAISLTDSIENTITDLEVLDLCCAAIFLMYSNDNEITNNVLSHSSSGIVLSYSNNNLISKNNIVRGERTDDYGTWGISLFRSNDNIIQENKISNHKSSGKGTSPESYGIELSESKNNEVISNNILENGNGLYIQFSSQNFIESNIISKNQNAGIQLRNINGPSVNNIFQSNIISGSKIGIDSHSSQNTYVNNSIKQNTVGMSLGQDGPTYVRTSNNLIYNNNFIDNTKQVTYGAGNVFSLDDASGGNYWDDYSPDCSDSTNDNICDNSYPFSSGTVGVIDDFVWSTADGWKSSQKPIVSSQGSNLETSTVPENKIDPTLEKSSSLSQVSDSSPQKTKIPSWVQNIALWYGQGIISEDEFIKAIEYLLDQEILNP